MTLGTEITVSLISLAGVLIAGLLSWIVSRRQVSSEIHKLRFEIQRENAAELQKVRLSNYPSLYTILEKMSKAIQARCLDHDTFASCVAELDGWYSQYGLVLTADTNGRLYRTLRQFRSIANRKPEAFASRLHDNERRRQLINMIWEVIVGLRSDVGIFTVEFFDPKLRPRTYKEVDALLDED